VHLATSPFLTGFFVLYSQNNPLKATKLQGIKIPAQLVDNELSFRHVANIVGPVLLRST
jgi:hypothetical protein